MKVLVFPYSKANPYQELLSRGLENSGVNVETDPSFFRVVKLFPRPGFDLLHLHWLPGDIFRISLLLGKLLLLKILGVPIVWTVHNLTHHMHPGVLDSLNRRAVSRLATLLICHCEEAKGEVSEGFGVSEDKIRVVPHGNYIGVYPAAMSKDKAREKLGLPKEGLVFLVFGVAMRRKGLAGFVKEFTKLEKEATLVYAGKMKDRMLQKRLEDLEEGRDNIRYFFGYVPDEEVSAYFSACDVCAFTYKDALTSGSVALASSFGKPVVAPKVGCIPEQLGQEEGLLYDPKERGAVLKALNRVFEVDLEDLGRRNYEKVEAVDWDTIAKETSKIFEEAVKICNESS